MVNQTCVWSTYLCHSSPVWQKLAVFWGTQKAFGECVFAKFCDKNDVLVNFCDKNVFFWKSLRKHDGFCWNLSECIQSLSLQSLRIKFFLAISAEAWKLDFPTKYHMVGTLSFRYIFLLGNAGPAVPQLLPPCSITTVFTTGWQKLGDRGTGVPRKEDLPERKGRIQV